VDLPLTGRRGSQTELDGRRRSHNQLYFRSQESKKLITDSFLFRALDSTAPLHGTVNRLCTQVRSMSGLRFMTEGLREKLVIAARTGTRWSTRLRDQAMYCVHLLEVRASCYCRHGYCPSLD
jgi:hypothetical protein